MSNNNSHVADKLIRPIIFIGVGQVGGVFSAGTRAIIKRISVYPLGRIGVFCVVMGRQPNHFRCECMMHVGFYCG